MHLHQKGIDLFLQRLVLGDTQALRESRSPSLLLRRDAEIGPQLPPVLLVHGTGDKIVPPDQSEGFRQELLKSKVSVRLLFHEGQGHNDPVIHSPMMSNHETVEAIILSIHEWTSGQRRDPAEKPKANNKDFFPNSSDCKAQFAALPTWPRTPEAVRSSALRLWHRSCNVLWKREREREREREEGRLIPQVIQIARLLTPF